MRCAVVRAGLVEAKIDELNAKIIVRFVGAVWAVVARLLLTHQNAMCSRSTFTAFGINQWRDLKVRLEAWQKNISDVQRVLSTVKLQHQQKVRSF